MRPPENHRITRPKLPVPPCIYRALKSCRPQMVTNTWQWNMAEVVAAWEEGGIPEVGGA